MKKLITIIILTLALSFSTCNTPSHTPSRRYIYTTDTIFGPDGKPLYIKKSKKGKERVIEYPFYITILAAVIVAFIALKHNK